MANTHSTAPDDGEPGPATRAWHYTPDLPLTVAPYYQWPCKPLAVARWLIGGWFPLSERLIILVLAIFSWAFFHPAIETCRELSLDWVALIYLRNLALMILVAGGLHLYFYVWRCQGDECRYDRRPLIRNSRVFTFGSQVRDNMFWTCVSGVSIWTAYEVLMMWSMANGFVPMLSLQTDWAWMLLLILLLPAWETVHFFVIHRLIHWSPLYRRVHALHHRNTNVGPWSGLSMHPLEHLVYLSTVLIHFVVPANPLLLIFHLQYFTLSAATTHTGYQGIRWRGRLVLPLGTFHHQLHHRYFECNYGGLEVPMDQWTGNFHDGTAASHAAFLKRRRKPSAP